MSAPDPDRGEQVRAHTLRIRRLPHELRERGDELSLLAASLIEALREKTAVHLGWTDVPTGERVNIYAPSNRCLQIAGDRPTALQIAARHVSGNEDFSE